MANFAVTPTDTTIVVQVGENTAAAAAFATLSQAWAEGTLPGGPGTKSAREWATDAEGFAGDADTSANVASQARDVASQARDVAIAAGVQYPNEAAAVAALADGAFGSYLDPMGNPVWGRRTGATMTPLPGPWIGGDRVDFQQSGAGAVVRTVRDKLRDIVSAADYDVVGNGITDDTAVINAALAANPGKTIVFSGMSLVTPPINISSANTKLVFQPGAGFTYTNPTAIGVNVSGDNVVIEGITVNAPAVFDAANVAPTYGCIWVTGDNCRIENPTLNNVPKVGIFFKDCEGGRVFNAKINGNFPPSSFTGAQTGHAGILLDSPPSGRQGNFIVSGNDITGCVQGVLIANYGDASLGQGIVISSNTFFSCWDHGVYSAGFDNGIVVDGNSFVFCRIPITATGKNHVIANNSITTGGSTGTFTDVVGISLRGPVNCVVTGNTISGDAGVAQTVINLSTITGTVVRGNVVSGNIINITNSTGSSTLIQVGGNDCTDLTDNIVSSNVCLGTGRPDTGLIVFTGGASCPAYGTICSGNSIAIRSSSYGIGLTNVIGAKIANNKIRLEFDAVSSVVLAGIVASNAVNCDFNGNDTIITASWGANINFRNFWEVGTSSGNRASNNSVRADLTKLLSSTPYVTLSGSGIIVQDTGSGAPNFNAGVGSTWCRIDGGALTTFYVKESGASATGWVGK